MPCGLVTVGDIAIESIALETISVTFYTMVTSSAPVFVLLSAFAFAIEKITVALVASVLLIAAGEVHRRAGTARTLSGIPLCVFAAPTPRSECEVVPRPRSIHTVKRFSRRTQERTLRRKELSACRTFANGHGRRIGIMLCRSCSRGRSSDRP